jgi:hypothetical protein
MLYSQPGSGPTDQLKNSIAARYHRIGCGDERLAAEGLSQADLLPQNAAPWRNMKL